MVGLKTKEFFIREIDFQLGENHSYKDGDKYGDFNQLTLRDCRKFISAISQQKASLRELFYRPSVGNTRGAPMLQPTSIPHDCEGFAACEKLEAVHLLNPCATFLELISNENTVPPNVEKVHVKIPGFKQQLSQVSLQQNEVIVEADNNNTQLHTLCHRVSKLPKLKEFAIIKSARIPGKFKVANQRLVESAYKSFDSKTVRLLVIHHPQRTGYIPPYLYGEPLPTQEVIYDNRADGWSTLSPNWRRRRDYN